MTPQELVEHIDRAIVMLKLNREAIPVDELNELDRHVDTLASPETLNFLDQIMGQGFSKSITSLQKVIDIERQMLEVQPGKSQSATDKLIESLERLKARKMVLKMVCNWVL